MGCNADGAGAFLGMTVSKDWRCLESPGDLDNQITETQALLRTATDAVTVATVFRVRSAGPWDVAVESFDSPHVEDGVGQLARKRKGSVRSNPPRTFTVTTDGTQNLSFLVGAEGTIRSWEPDGSYFEGYGWISSATLIGNHDEGETTHELVVQWQGGSPSDAGFVTHYNASDVEQFPSI